MIQPNIVQCRVCKRIRLAVDLWVETSPLVDPAMVSQTCCPRCQPKSCRDREMVSAKPFG